LSLLIVDDPDAGTVSAHALPSGCNTHAEWALPCYRIGMTGCEVAASTEDAWLFSQARLANVAPLLDSLT
jgi:hypothetical protein